MYISVECTFEHFTYCNSLSLNQQIPITQLKKREKKTKYSPLYWLFYIQNRYDLVVS